MQIPQQLLELIRKVKRVAVLTGPGILAEGGSGFGDPNHPLWSRFRPEDLANAEAFRRDPGLVWGWYEWRRAALRHHKVNPAHTALVTLEHRVPEFMLITQNVDGLHAAAGSRHLVELHGNLMRDRCSAGCKAGAGVDGTGVDDAGVDDNEPPPRCPGCGAPLRPDVLWPGEALPEETLRAAHKAVSECELFFVIGTAAPVPPAAIFPRLALESGAALVEINRDETAISGGAHATLRGPAALVLPHLLQTAWPAN